MLCTIKGKHWLHLVKEVTMHKNQEKFVIGNNKGKINGMIGRERIHGICIKVED